MTKLISDYDTAYEYADDYGKVPQYSKKIEELDKQLRDLDHQIYTEVRLINQKWIGYNVLKESMYEAENKDWNGEADDECRKITGDCYEIWHSIHSENAEFMKKAAITHARQLVKAEDLRTQTQSERDKTWEKKWQEMKKGREVWEKNKEKNSEKGAA